MVSILRKYEKRKLEDREYRKKKDEAVNEGKRELA